MNKKILIALFSAILSTGAYAGSQALDCDPSTFTVSASTGNMGFYDLPASQNNSSHPFTFTIKRPNPKGLNWDTTLYIKGKGIENCFFESLTGDYSHASIGANGFNAAMHAVTINVLVPYEKSGESNLALRIMPIYDKTGRDGIYFFNIKET